MGDRSGFSNGAGASCFWIYKPEKWLPLLYRPGVFASFLARQRLLRALRFLRSKGCKKIILYLWRPEFESALDLIPNDLSCYHIDDEYSFSDIEQPMDPREERLISRVGQVFIHSKTLFEKKAYLNARTLLIPNGVNYDAYASEWDEPEDLRPIPHPRVGYTGVIKKQLDWPLLLELAEARPEWSFVFVGPNAPHQEIVSYIEKLSRKKNVHFLGEKPAEYLPAYTRHFDVCIMPYRRNDYTKYIYPLKLHEYLASGKPVIGTPIPALEDFRSVVDIADSVPGWSCAIAEALSPAAKGMDQCQARQAIARQHDWNLLVWRIAETLAERLGQEVAKRMREAHQFQVKDPF
ncbi:MAG: glycosyltransferase [Candidatus Methanoperedens sp.]|nr:glycosyltransferase [Candidatus Methanoperedens sp.]